MRIPEKQPGRKHAIDPVVGLDTIILGLFHIGRTKPPYSPPQILGDINFNDTLIISQGAYVGDRDWPDAVSKLIGRSVTTLLASFGGAKGWVYDFTTIEHIYTSNHNSFSGTNLEQNFALFRTLLPHVTTIDMDNEDNYGSRPSFVAFCRMLIGMGFTITFCPYQEQDFWTKSLTELEQSHPGAVIWWNLQCYAGGGGNDPATWAGYIKSAIPGFNTDRYILASDWTRFWDNTHGTWSGDCPPDTESLLAHFKGELCVGGAFLWTVDQIIDFPNISKQHPGSGCDSEGGSQTAYVNAIRGGLLLMQSKS